MERPINSRGLLSYIAANLLVFCCIVLVQPRCALPNTYVRTHLKKINQDGPYLGLIIPNKFELDPLLQSKIFTPSTSVPNIDLAGRRFYFGKIEKHNVIVVMTGLGMLNAGITTQLLLSHFHITGVLHYGIAGNANDALNIGDITIPKYWAHTGLWCWQRFGEGPDDLLPLESNGDYTREVGYLGFGNYNVPVGNRTNLLNNIWYQPEEVFPVTGTPEVRQHFFWVPVDEKFYSVASKIQDVTLISCINSTSCLSSTPKVVMVERGASANIYLDNAAYRGFLFRKFNVSPVDMESAGVALVCLTNETPFIAIRALSDLAGGSSVSNEAEIFLGLAASNGVLVVGAFIKQLGRVLSGNE